MLLRPACQTLIEGGAWAPTQEFRGEGQVALVTRRFKVASSVQCHCALHAD